MQNTLTIGVLLFLLTQTGARCEEPAPATKEAAKDALMFDDVWRQMMLRRLTWTPKHHKREYFVFHNADTSAKELEQTWIADGGRKEDIPPIDFNTEMLIVLFLDAKTADHHAIRIERVYHFADAENDRMLVLYSENKDAPAVVAEAEFPSDMLVVKNTHPSHCSFYSIDSKEGKELLKDLVYFKDTPVPTMPAIQVKPRAALRDTSKLVYDEYIRGYRGPGKPRERKERDAEGRIPVGVEKTAAAELAVKLATENFHVDAAELKVADISTSWRGLDLPFVGWTINLAQVSHGAPINVGRNLPLFADDAQPFERAGVEASVYNDDDWDIRAHLLHVTDDGEARPVIGENEARMRAESALRVQPDQQLEYRYAALVYYSEKGVSTRLVPAWRFTVLIRPDPAKLYSYSLSHQGYSVVLNAWTGELIGGAPAEDRWKERAERWNRDDKLPLGWADAEPALRAALDRLSLRLTEKEVDEILKPFTRDTALRYEGGTGDYEKFYALGKDRQIEIGFAGHFVPEEFRRKTRDLGPLTARTPWIGLFWNPETADLERAGVIAEKYLRAEIDAGRLTTAKFSTNPAGRAVTDHAVEIRLTERGVEHVYSATGSGRFQRHKLIELNLMDGGTWVHQLTVDMDDNAVVPSRWDPSDADIKTARAIADPACQDFITQAGQPGHTLEVRAWGEYDYAPLRRILTLDYSDGHGAAGTELRFMKVDMDHLKVDDPH